MRRMPTQPPQAPLATGPYFYRFGSPENLQWLEPIILRHELHIPLASEFNDLRDCRPRPKPLSLNDWTAYLKSRVPHTPLPAEQAALADELPDIVASLGAEALAVAASQSWHKRTTNHHIYCMSRRWDNLSMWHWYAGKHTGYCLEFARVGMFADVREVLYGPSSLYDLTDPTHATPNWFFHKLPDWSNEEEVRLVLPRSQGGPTFSMPLNQLARVILGKEMRRENVERIRSWGVARVPPIPVVIAKWDEINLELVAN